MRIIRSVRLSVQNFQYKIQDCSKFAACSLSRPSKSLATVVRVTLHILISPTQRSRLLFRAEMNSPLFSRDRFSTPPAMNILPFQKLGRRLNNCVSVSVFTETQTGLVEFKTRCECGWIITIKLRIFIARSPAEQINKANTLHMLYQYVNVKGCDKQSSQLFLFSCWSATVTQARRRSRCANTLTSFPSSLHSWEKWHKSARQQSKRWHGTVDQWLLFNVCSSFAMSDPARMLSEIRTCSSVIYCPIPVKTMKRGGKGPGDTWMWRRQSTGMTQGLGGHLAQNRYSSGNRDVSLTKPKTIISYMKDIKGDRFENVWGASEGAKACEGKHGGK